MNAIEEVYLLSKAMFVVALFATVPGYWFSVFLIDRIGRFKIQLGGFFLMAVFMAVLGFKYDEFRGTACDPSHHSEYSFCGGETKLFALFYGLTLFFTNFGPNSTTFILPAELFPARFQSTCHGLSAAAGKAGAIVGAFGVQSYTQDVSQIKKAIVTLTVVCLVGFFFTFLVPETKGRSLEEISGEDKELGGDGDGDVEANGHAKVEKDGIELPASDMV